MTVHPSDETPPAARGAPVSLAAAMRRSDARLDAVIADLALDESLRLDEQARALVLAMLEQAVEATATAIAAEAARRLPRAAIDTRNVLARLTAGGLMQDRALIRAAIDAARMVLIDDALAGTRAPDEAPILFAHLAQHHDPVVRDTAKEFLLAENGARSGPIPSVELPVAVEQRLAWSVAAVLATRNGGDDAVRDAVVDATAGHLAALDPDRYVPASARRLAEALGADDNERDHVVLAALGEGHLALFNALVSQMTGIIVDEVATAALDTDAELLLTMIRSANTARDTLARVGLRLADADRGRDADALADIVDRVAALSPPEAAQAIAPLRLDPAFRAALRQLERASR